MSNRIKTIVGVLAVGAVGIGASACGTGEQEATAAENKTTTEEVQEVGMGTVESAFAVSMQKEGDRITEGKPNQSITTDKVDCQRTGEGKAICYVTATMSIGGYEDPFHAAWNVTYDTEDGHPLAYHSR